MGLEMILLVAKVLEKGPQDPTGGLCLSAAPRHPGHESGMPQQGRPRMREEAQHQARALSMRVSAMVAQTLLETGRDVLLALTDIDSGAIESGQIGIHI